MPNMNFAAEMTRLRKERDELLAALKEGLRYVEPLCQAGDPLGLDMRRIFSAAIAKAEAS